MIRLRPSLILSCNFLTNCLANRFRCRPKFYNWLPIFLANTQAVLNYRYEPNFYYSLPLFFLCSLWHFSHMSLPYPLCDDLMSFCFMLCVGPYGCCCGLNPKSTRGVSHLLLWWKIVITIPTRISLHNFWVNGCKFGPEGSLKMVLSLEH